MTPRASREGAHAIREARWPYDRGVVEDLFREYVAALGVDVSFQNVEEEFASLPGNMRGRPAACSWLGTRGNRPG